MVQVIALKDLDRTTGPTPKGTVFDMDEDGAKIHYKLGNIAYHKPEADPAPPADPDPAA